MKPPLRARVDRNSGYNTAVGRQATDTTFVEGKNPTQMAIHQTLETEGGCFIFEPGGAT
jgi:hypothetical protein